MKLLKHLLAGVCLMLGLGQANAVTLAGLQNAHDPGTVTKDGGTYFNFTTGNGIWYSTSRDLVTWQAGPAPVFASWPAWVKNKIPTFNGSFWAPDVVHMNGHYYLYYSVSTFGTSSSAIGVARSVSLKNPSWQDLGIVVESYGGSGEINAIDPALFRDHDGKVYMSYGSFFGGIGVAQINQATGKLAGSVTHLLGGGSPRDYEAPYITHHGGYYYLFVNRGACCKGADSSYYVQVLRATSVTGPYSGARTVLANIDANFKGPGHIGVLKQDGCQFVSTHYYDTSDNGNAKLQFHKMSYSSDGWPVLTRNFASFAGCGGISDGAYAFKSRLSGKALTVGGASTANGALVVQASDTGARHQSWYVVGRGDGYYSILNANSLRSLDNYGNSTTAGTSIDQWDYWAGTGQRWRFASPAPGYVTVANQLSGMVLDVSARSLNENAQIIQYPVNNASNQQWSLHRR